jgi:hypothetical protein
MDALSSVDESFARLRAACWSVGDVQASTPAGAAYWLVTGTTGASRIGGTGRTQAEAWHSACRQAKALGLADRPTTHKPHERRAP